MDLVLAAVLSQESMRAWSPSDTGMPNAACMRNTIACALGRPNAAAFLMRSKAVEISWGTPNPTALHSPSCSNASWDTLSFPRIAALSNDLYIRSGIVLRNSRL